VFLTALISGVSIFVNKFGVKETNPYVFAFLKNTIVAIFLCSILFLVKEFKSLSRLKKKDWLNLVLIGLFGGSIPFLLFFKGLTMTTAVNSAFIHKTMFIYVALLSLMFFKEKLNKNVLAAALFLLAGNFMFLKMNSFSFGAGDLLIFIATLFWAVEIAISKRALRNLSGNVVAFGRMFFGSFFILLFLAVSGNYLEIMSLNINQFYWIALTSVFLFLYVLTFYNGLKYVNATVATSILLLGSVVTTLLNVFFSGAGITLMQAIGMLFLVLGIVSYFGIVDLLKKLKSYAFSTAKP